RPRAPTRVAHAPGAFAGEAVDRHDRAGMRAVVHLRAGQRHQVMAHARRRSVLELRRVADLVLPAQAAAAGVVAGQRRLGAHARQAAQGDVDAILLDQRSPLENRDFIALPGRLDVPAFAFAQIGRIAVEAHQIAALVLGPFAAWAERLHAKPGE